MRLARRALIVVGAAALTVPFAASSAFSAPSRGSISGSVPGWTRAAHSTGSTSSSKRVSFNVVLKLRNQAGAEALAAAVSDPNSKSYGHYLTSSQFNAAYAPTAGQVKKVSDYLKSQGIKVSGVAQGNRWVEASGTVAQINQAFDTSIKNYSYKGKNIYGPSKTLSMPSAVAGVVGAVVGVSSEGALRQPANIGNGAPVSDSAAPDANKPPASSCSHYWGEHTQTVPEAFGKTSFPTPGCGYSPANLRQAYGMQSAVSHGNDGRGVTVAIIDAYASPTIEADTNQLSTENGEPTFAAGQLTQTTFGPFNLQDECGGEAGWNIEESIDVQSAHGLAPGANIHYIGAQNCDTGIDDAANYVIQNHVANIVSNSYGFAGEDGLGDEVNTEHSMFIQAAIEGIGFYYSSGDDGDNFVFGNTTHPEPDFPSSDPLVTAVGGTTLAVNPNGSYDFETTWGNWLDPVDFTGATAQYSLPLPGEFLSGGGGGVSGLFAEPAYQKLAVPNKLAKLNGGKPMRVVPDVAALGDPETGFIIVVGGAHAQFGGTSLACPIFAGIQALASQGRRFPIGFANPLLYSATNLLGGFRDIKDPAPDTLVYATNSGSNLLPAAMDTSLIAVKGYDDATGLGTPNGAAFLLSEKLF
jgi:subtilase family serine protease